MRLKVLGLLISLTTILSTNVFAQLEESELGAWYMYFFQSHIKEDNNWGIQGDVQWRNWNLMGDLEQLLLRGGVMYKPSDVDIKFTLGYGHVTTGEFGENSNTSFENRIYQEALFPVKFGKRFYSNHRFRYEQRFVENQDFRTRFRYNLFLNVALNKPEMEKNTWYLALYNELFINGQRDIGNEKSVEIFDRNRFYSGLGFILNKKVKFQLGIMNQTTDYWSKNQVQVSFHQKIGL